MDTPTPSLTQTRRLAPLMSAMAIIVALAAACGGSSADDSAEEPNPDRPQAESAEAGSDAGGSTSDATLGWIVTGPDGTEFEFTETLTANNAETVNSYTYTIDAGQPRQGLYTQFVMAATVDVTVSSGGPATVQLVRGTLADDGFSVVAVDVLDTQDVAVGATVSLSSG